MLDGWWQIDIAEASGMSAASRVLLRNGIVFQNSETADATGTYEEQGNAFRATLEVTLDDPAPSSGRLSERALLHLQGQVGAHTIWASGVDLTNVHRRVNVRLQRRALIERYPVSARTSSPDVPAVARLWRDTVKKLGVVAARAKTSEPSWAGATAPRFAKARLPREILDEARGRLASATPAHRPANVGPVTPSSVLASANPRAGTAP